jgi:hypothetical protein
MGDLLSKSLAVKPPLAGDVALSGWRRALTTPSLPEAHRSIPVAADSSWFRKILAFAGPGYLIAVGYMDPGNWATDIGGGSRFGYLLLSAVLVSSLMAMFPPGPRCQVRHRHRTRSRSGLPRPLFPPNLYLLDCL